MKDSTKGKFWAKIGLPNEGCWPWLSAISSSGYGVFTMDSKSYLAHRVMCELAFGPIPSGLTVDHLCRNKLCVNPYHFDIVTGKVNTLRGNNPCATRARKTHCANGHPLQQVDSSGERGCRVCRNEYHRKRHERMKNQGLCLTCGKQSNPHFVRCDRCLEKRRIQ